MRRLGCCLYPIVCYGTTHFLLHIRQCIALTELYVKNLSGGELQRVAIALCLGQPASVYLLDEPSAGLVCEQRIITSKVIRRWVINHMQKTAFVRRPPPFAPTLLVR